MHKGEVALLALSLNPGAKALGTLNPKRLLRSLRTEALDLASVTAFRMQGAANVSATILQRANLRGEAAITDRIFSFAKSEHGGGRGFGKKPSSIPNGCINGSVPGRVQSRINICIGDGTRCHPGIEWAWRKHGGIENKNKSQFTISKEEVNIILQDKQVVQSPVGMIERGQKQDLEERLFVREVYTGKVIGNLRSKDGSAQPTKLITVITDYEGNLHSVYPGPFKHTFDKS